MVSATETVRRASREEGVYSTSGSVPAGQPGTAQWWIELSDSGLIYPQVETEVSPSSNVPESAPLYIPGRPTSYGFSDILGSVMKISTAFTGAPGLPNREAQELDLRRFIAREAKQLTPVVAIEAADREDAKDILVVVEGDLFDGERTVLPLMRRLRENFPDRVFDVMVLPASHYRTGFRWGQSPTVLFCRQG